jgi:phage tail-like protein
MIPVQFQHDHLLLNQQAGWRGAFLEGTVLQECGGDLELAPAPGPPQPLLSGLALPASLALDGRDRIYLLDQAAGEIKRFDPCDGVFVTLPCMGGAGDGPRRFGEARAIAIWKNTLLVAEAGNRRVQAFALESMTLRAIWGPYQVTEAATGIAVKRIALHQPPEAGTWQPVALAIAPCGTAYVADYANGLIHLFDRLGCWCAAYNGVSATSPHLEKPVQIALDRAGNLYIAQEGKSEIVVLRPTGEHSETITPPDRPTALCPTALAVDDQGRLHLSDAIHRSITVVCRAAGGYTVKETYSAGAAADLVFDSAGNLIVVDAQAGQLNVVAPQALYATTGAFFSEGLDSRSYNCPWDRIWLRASIPSGCRVFVDTLTSEADKSGAELITLPDTRWTRAGTLSQTGEVQWDCLVQSAPGRYLWLRLTLEGEGPATPKIFEVRAFLPRNTSLQYLPATYAADTEGKRFLDEFLSITDAILLRDIGGRISQLAAYFDPASTPAGAGEEPDFLTWLGSWLGLAVERKWPETKRRALVAAAHRLYRLRGTPEGLREHLRIYTGRAPTIVEQFKMRRWLELGAGRLGAKSSLWSADIVNRLQLDEHAQVGSAQLIDTQDPLRDPFWSAAHRFSVFVPAPESAGDAEQADLERIVAMARPAHTAAKVHLLRRRFRIGYQSFVGIDTVLGHCAPPLVTGQRKLGYDTVLGAAGGSGGVQIGIHSRVAVDTRVP